MSLKQAIKTCVNTARRKRLREYERNTQHPPIDGHPAIEDTDTPLLGYCLENARALASELDNHGIHYQPIRGYIIIEAIENTDIAASLTNAQLHNYVNSDTGTVNPSLWEVIGHPSEDEFPDEYYHWWVMIDGSQTTFDSDAVFHAEISSEARNHRGTPTVYNTEPTQYYYWTRHGYRKQAFTF